MQRIDWHMFGAKTIINGFGAYALYISFGHITSLFAGWGAAPDQAQAAPLFVDGFMVLGRIMMSRRFEDRTNRIGRSLVAAGAVLSLTANLLAGHSFGARVLGGMIVAGYLVCEWAAGNVRTRAAAAPAALAVPVVDKAEERRAARRERDRARRAERREAELAAAAAAEEKRAAAAERRRLARQVADLEASFAAPAAPVSPAPIGEEAAYL